MTMRIWGGYQIANTVDSYNHPHALPNFRITGLGDIAQVEEKAWEKDYTYPKD